MSKSTVLARILSILKGLLVLHFWKELMSKWGEWGLKVNISSLEFSGINIILLEDTNSQWINFMINFERLQELSFLAQSQYYHSNSDCQ